MADFLTAFNNTAGHEGGYVVDYYSETYQGITRKGYPGWPGWQLIDAWKKKYGRPRKGMFFSFPQMESLVQSFYKKNFWDKMAGNYIQNQTLANLIFDFSVNSNSALFIINRVLGARVSNSINEDSLKIINERPAFAYMTILEARKNKYVSQAQNPSKKKYLKGWLARLNKFPAKITA